MGARSRVSRPPSRGWSVPAGIGGKMGCGSVVPAILIRWSVGSMTRISLVPWEKLLRSGGQGKTPLWAVLKDDGGWYTGAVSGTRSAPRFPSSDAYCRESPGARTGSKGISGAALSELRLSAGILSSDARCQPSCRQPAHKEATYCFVDDRFLPVGKRFLLHGGGYIAQPARDRSKLRDIPTLATTCQDFATLQCALFLKLTGNTRLWWETRDAKKPESARLRKDRAKERHRTTLRSQSWDEFR
jgi:hypothetical protein